MTQNRDKTRVTIEKIRKILAENPGKPLPLEPSFAELPRAAVAMILKPDAVGSVSILLIKRKIRDNDPWSGNMALPGGRYSLIDKDLYGTAVREVQEEMGVDLRQFRLLGTLDEIVSTNFLIRVSPFVAAMPYLDDRKLLLKIDAKEIETHVWIPLSYFKDERNATSLTVERLGQKSETQSYKFGGEYMVWGMTLRMIKDLLAKLG